MKKATGFTLLALATAGVLAMPGVASVQGINQCAGHADQFGGHHIDTSMPSIERGALVYQLYYIRDFSGHQVVSTFHCAVDFKWNGDYSWAADISSGNDARTITRLVTQAKGALVEM